VQWHTIWKAFFFFWFKSNNVNRFVRGLGLAIKVLSYLCTCCNWAKLASGCSNKRAWALRCILGRGCHIDSFTVNVNTPASRTRRSSWVGRKKIKKMLKFLKGCWIYQDMFDRETRDRYVDKTALLTGWIHLKFPKNSGKLRSTSASLVTVIVLTTIHTCNILLTMCFRSVISNVSC